MRHSYTLSQFFKRFFLRHYLNTLFISILFLSLGCKKYVQVDPPATQLVTATVFNNSSTASSALFNIYQQMYNNAESFNMSQTTGFLGDELTNYSTSILNIQYYTNSMSALLNTFGPWNNAYNYIYQANAIIEGLLNNSTISQPIRNQLTGESKFIRAFWHFYLTNCYGDVPVVTSTNYTTNASLSRTPRTQVYNQIIADLKDAEALLNTNYVDATDTSVTMDRVRPTKWAATALLARAYLYTQKWDSAEEQATSVIGNSSTYSLDTLNGVFLVNSSEAIWQLATPLPNSYNTKDGYAFILQGEPNDNQGQTISTQLLNAFEPGDNRKTNWLGSINNFYYPNKYKVYTSDAITEYTTILRLAEQYLIRAEARVQLGNTAEAVADLNVIRHRAGLTDYGGITTQVPLLSAILHERQIELFAEWGHRWFDLVRTGTANVVMGSPGNLCMSKGGSWSPNWQLFPIPQSERSKDHNLTQNIGY